MKTVNQAVFFENLAIHRVKKHVYLTLICNNCLLLFSKVHESVGNASITFIYYVLTNVILFSLELISTEID